MRRQDDIVEVEQLVVGAAGLCIKGVERETAVTPHMAGSPRTNGLQDIAELITGLAEALFA